MKNKKYISALKEEVREDNISNINKEIKIEDAKYFLKFYHDLSITENTNNKSLSIASYFGHSYIELINTITESSIFRGKNPASHNLPLYKGKFWMSNPAPN
jgi:hypothetical protein